MFSLNESKSMQTIIYEYETESGEIIRIQAEESQRSSTTRGGKGDEDTISKE